MEGQIGMYNTLLGIVLAIVSNSMFYIGNVMQKKGADSLPKIEAQSVKQNIKNFLTNRIWLIGWILATLQWFIWLIAAKLVPLSLIMPMMGIGLIVLVIFSHFYLKEKIIKKEIIAICIIIVGVIVLGITSPAEEPIYTLTQINRDISKIGSIIFTIILFLLVIIPMVISISKKYIYAGVIFGFSSGVLAGIGAIYSKAFMGGIGGISIFETIKYWQWWMYVVFVIIGNIGMTVVQQIGFQKGKAIVVSPITTITNLIISVLGGIFIYSEWMGLNFLMINIKTISITVIVIGVAILFFSSAKSKEKEQSKSELKKNSKNINDKVESESYLNINRS